MASIECNKAGFAQFQVESLSRRAKKNHQICFSLCDFVPQADGATLCAQLVSSSYAEDKKRSAGGMISAFK